jgi:hypothetical protein
VSTDELTLVAVARDWAEAAFIEGVLQSGGIRCIQLGDEAGGWQPNLTFVEGIRILCPRFDAERAQVLLKKISSQTVPRSKKNAKRRRHN